MKKLVSWRIMKLGTGADMLEGKRIWCGVGWLARSFYMCRDSTGGGEGEIAKVTGDLLVKTTRVCPIRKLMRFFLTPIVSHVEGTVVPCGMLIGSPVR